METGETSVSVALFFAIFSQL